MLHSFKKVLITIHLSIALSVEHVIPYPNIHVAKKTLRDIITLSINPREIFPLLELLSKQKLGTAK